MLIGHSDRVAMRRSMLPSGVLEDMTRAVRDGTSASPQVTLETGQCPKIRPMFDRARPRESRFYGTDFMEGLRDESTIFISDEMFYVRIVAAIAR